MTDKDFDTITELLRGVESSVQNARKLAATRTEAGLQMAEQYMDPIMMDLKEIQRMLRHRQEES